MIRAVAARSCDSRAQPQPVWVGQANSTWPDLDIMDLGRDSGFFGKPAAQLHATTWMMARSPLFYGGDLPITDEYTINLVTNEVALAINAHSSGLQVDYDGDCSCHAWPAASHACKLFNNPATEPCVATWWSSFGQCTALAVLNIGNKTASHSLGRTSCSRAL